MKKIIAGILCLFLFTSTVSACGDWGHEQVACAATVTQDDSFYKGSSGGGSGGGGGGRSSGGASSGKSSGGASGGKSSSGQAPKPGQAGTPKTGSQTKAAQNSKPTSKPDPKDIATAKSEAPKSVSRNGSYYSSVTGNTYIYQPPAVFLTPGYTWDIMNPYNRYNYWYMPMSPFYHTPYIERADCDSQEQEVKNENNITIVLDEDGKVVSSSETKDTLPAHGTTVVLR